MILWISGFDDVTLLNDYKGAYLKKTVAGGQFGWGGTLQKRYL